MSDRDRWGFDGLSDREYDELLRSCPTPRPAGRSADGEEAVGGDDPLTGRDPHGLAAVSVDQTGRPFRVRMTARPAAEVDAAAAGRALTSAANAAAVRAAQLRQTMPGHDRPNPTETSEGLVTPAALRAMCDAAVADARAFATASSEALTRIVEVSSRDGHVSGRGRAGIVLSAAIDAGWWQRTRRVLVEAEALDLLCRLRSASAPDFVRAGPTHPAHRALMNLARDPRAVARSAGLIVD